MSDEHLERERTIRALAGKALQDGKITKEEHDRYLEWKLTIAAAQQPSPELPILPAMPQSPSPQTSAVARPAVRSGSRTPLIGIAIVLILLVALLFILVPFSNFRLTGFAAMEAPRSYPVNLTFTHSANYTLNVTNVTAVIVTGTLSNGTVSILADGLLVYEGTAGARYGVTTEKESYALGETVHAIVLPAGSSYTLWLTDERGEMMPAGTIVTATPGEFQLDALINDSGRIAKTSVNFTVRNDTDPGQDIARSGNADDVEFIRACAETCELDSTGPLDLAIELSDGAQVVITSIMVAQKPNLPPVLEQSIPDVALLQGEQATTDLSAYFSDADGDSLMYTSAGARGIELAVNGSILTIVGIEAGSTEAAVYASDLHTLIASNAFTITVLPGANATNSTAGSAVGDATPGNAAVVTNTTAVNAGIGNAAAANATTDASEGNATTDNTVGNTTGGAAGNATSSTVLEDAEPAAGAADCSNPNPNLRPVECLYQESAAYFPDAEILLANFDRAPVARFTPIGNLLIRGRIIEHSAASPGSRDFRIGYVDNDGNSIATIWIDGQTGDLHLKGTLREENTNLVPPAGSYSLKNKRSVFLAYADQRQGDLFVRGNVVPYRFEVQSWE